MNRFLLKNIVSRKVISFSDISAVNFIVGENLLVSLINRVGTSEILCFIKSSA